jgi:hypothetical protein
MAETGRESVATRPLEGIPGSSTADPNPSSEEPRPRYEDDDHGQTWSSRPWRLLTLGRSLLRWAVACGAEVCANPVEALRRGRKPILTVAFAAAGFVVACVALWSTVRATSDGRKAEMLAEWTAKKDFIEFCWTVSSPSIHSHCLDELASLRYTDLSCPALVGTRRPRLRVSKGHDA